ncbi:uncharacterized protein PG998_000360 [Apiospora kogelbergensis]|uniref:uncharacterized protein n=1 Tax=Apiospora kogelbergensis TaxID=1337665 RepID=UPI00313176AF
MEPVVDIYNRTVTLIASLERSKKDSEELKKALDDRDRMEFEAWKAAGCPDMLAKDGDECLDWRGVGFPLWFEVKSLKTMEPVVKKEHTALKATEPVAKNEHEAMVKTKFGLRKAITSTPFEKGKTTILGGGPLVEFVFDDS